MESNLVIKVKYGDTLRRFSARIDASEQLDLNMAGLRAKIIQLFNFPFDTQLTLTYMDEDGDVVTLVDDDDLSDVMRQRLKFLRIDVRLNNDKLGIPYAGSSGISTPLRSSSVLPQSASFNTGATDVLKSVPEPLRDALSEVFSKLSFDIALKAASACPAMGDVVECLSKIGQYYLSPVSVSGAATDSGIPVGSSESPCASTNTDPLRDGGLRAVLPKFMAVDSSCNTSKEANTGNATRGVDVPAISDPAAVDLNVDSPADPNLTGCAPMSSGPSASNAFACNYKKNTKESRKSVSFDTSTPFIDTTRKYFPFNGMGRNPSNEYPFNGFPIANDPVVHPINGLPVANNPVVHPVNGLPVANDPVVHPFNGLPVANDPVVPPFSYHPFSPSKRSFVSNDANVMFGIFHKGIQCDGCGVLPITGPRFKSKVKDDYDLCSICFSKMGNEADYIRLDRPVHFRHPWYFRASNDHIPRFGGPALPHGLRNRVLKSARPKLESRFILDVNVPDGTVMAPSTSFTKIWRMCNNGTMPWFCGMQLVWIGGDKLKNAMSVDIQIPTDGVPVDGELDIAVDFTAPQLPGRYVSYWRMASQSGIKFGQRVWVLIHVDASLKDTISDNLDGLNLNLPPESSGPRDSDILDMNVDFVTELCNSSAGAGPVKPMVNEQSTKEQKVDNSDVPTHNPTSSSVTYPVVDQGVLETVFRPPTTISSSSAAYPVINQGVSVPAFPQTPSSSFSYPIIDLSEEAPAGPFQVPSPAICVQAASEEENENTVEQTLLKELEDIGFKQFDLNKEILRMNEFDLEKSVDDLCGVAEWDPILEELLEMGFCDEEMNKKLLRKNNGSIKGVVLDLLTGEKEA